MITNVNEKSFHEIYTYITFSYNIHLNNKKKKIYIYIYINARYVKKFYARCMSMKPREQELYQTFMTTICSNISEKFMNLKFI